MTGARAIATPHPGDARYAIDGNWDTFWNSNKSQTGDESLTIDLGTPANISRIDILPSRIGDTPAHVAIDLSMDGDNWTTVADALNIGGMMWTGPNLAFQVWEMFSQYIFEPVQARYIKIRQTGHASKHWHVREIFAYERRPATTPATDAAPPWGEVLGFMNEQGIRSVISDFYFSANVITRSSGEIWANTRINRVNPDKRAKQEFGMGQFDAVAVHDRDWAQVKGYFDSQGTEPDVKRFGPYRLIYGLGDSPRQARTLDAGSCKVVDRTTTVVCDFGEPTNISVFRFAPDLLPFGKRITGWGASSPDNENWTEPIKARPVFGKVRWTGSHIVGMAPTGAYAIPETNTRFLRFALD